MAVPLTSATSCARSSVTNCNRPFDELDDSSARTSGPFGTNSLDILTRVQRAILQCVSAVPGQEQFYLTGGTALAYFYLQHRQSHDLDFFTTTEELITPWSHQLEAALHAQGMTTERRRGVASFVELVVRHGAAPTVGELAPGAGFSV